MTIAICQNCGDRKFGALVPCDKCGWKPYSLRECSVSMYCSDHFNSAQQLDAISKSIREHGEVSLDEDKIKDIELALEQNDIKLNKVWRTIPGTHFTWNFWTQKKRDQVVDDILNDIRLGNEPVFALYLRAFKEEESNDTRKLERKIVHALGSSNPLICLSKESSRIGATALETQDSFWQEHFLQLATFASIIFLKAPNLTVEGKVPYPSLLWELRAIDEHNLLSKVAFICFVSESDDYQGYMRMICGDGMIREINKENIYLFLQKHVEVKRRKATGPLKIVWELLIDEKKREDSQLPISKAQADSISAINRTRPFSLVFASESTMAKNGLIKEYPDISHVIDAIFSFLEGSLFYCKKKKIPITMSQEVFCFARGVIIAISMAYNEDVDMPEQDLIWRVVLETIFGFSQEEISEKDDEFLNAEKSTDIFEYAREAVWDCYFGNKKGIAKSLVRGHSRLSEIL